MKENLKFDIKFWIACLLLFFIFGSIFQSSNATIDNNTNLSKLSYDQIFYVGGNGPNNYTTIQAAVDDASDGDTVFVYDDSSPYLGAVNIDKSINLIGEDRNTTIIDGMEQFDIVCITCDYVKVENFNMTNGEDAVQLTFANNCIISNNNFFGYLFRAINLWVSHNNLITNNIIIGDDYKFRYGIVSFYGDNNIFTENSVSNVRHNPINIFSGINNTVSYNVVNSYKSYYGLGIRESSYSTVIFNTINTYGTDPDRDYNYIEVLGNFNKIENNKLNSYHSGLDVGIYIEGRNNLISKNFINSINGTAIDIFSGYSSYNIISYNDIIENKRGIWISGGNFNKILCNNFQDNGYNAFFYLFSLFNYWDGNYWDEPRSNPYPIMGRIFLSIIPWVKFDWNPASEPYDIEV